MSDLAERIKKRLEFKENIHACVKSSFEYEAKKNLVGGIWNDYSHGFEDGEKSAHAELVRELEPLIVEMAEGLKNIQTASMNADEDGPNGPYIYSRDAIYKIESWLATGEK